MGPKASHTLPTCPFYPQAVLFLKTRQSQEDTHRSNVSDHTDASSQGVGNHWGYTLHIT